MASGNQRDDERAAEIPEKEIEDEDDDRGTLQQGTLDGIECPRHQFDAVMERHHLHAGRQHPVDQLDLVFYPRNDLPAIAAAEHDGNAFEYLARAVARDAP